MWQSNSAPARWCLLAGPILLVSISTPTLTRSAERTTEGEARHPIQLAQAPLSEEEKKKREQDQQKKPEKGPPAAPKGQPPPPPKGIPAPAPKGPPAEKKV